MSREDKKDKLLLPWVIVGPEGVEYVGHHTSEDDAWRVFLGWPTRGEVREKKEKGYYAAQATVTWTKPIPNEATRPQR